nr:NUAK SNF1-like kinase 1 [Polyrhizophydium stewartii]
MRVPVRVALKCVEKSDPVKVALLAHEADMLARLQLLVPPASPLAPPESPPVADLLAGTPVSASTAPASLQTHMQPLLLEHPMLDDVLLFDRALANIVRAGGIVESPTVMGLVLDYFQGVELFDYIMEHHGVLASGPVGIAEAEAKHIFFSLLEATHLLHTNHIAHCDLKLENVLVAEADPPQIKLIDFGLSQVHDPAKPSPFARGSEPYMPPEFVLRQPVDPLKADIWALGVILFAMLTLRMPFDADPRSLQYGGGGGSNISIRSTGSVSESLSSAVSVAAAPSSPYSALDGAPLRSRPSLSGGNPATRRMFHRIAVGTYKYTQDEMAYLSPEARDLVALLLTRDAARRPRTRHLLAHPWFHDVLDHLAHEHAAAEREEAAAAAAAVPRPATAFSSSSADHRRWSHSPAAHSLK